VVDGFRDGLDNGLGHGFDGLDYFLRYCFHGRDRLGDHGRDNRLGNGNRRGLLNRGRNNLSLGRDRLPRDAPRASERQALPYRTFGPLVAM
jgi:hypothetical protein